MTREETIKDLRYIKNMNRNSLWQGRAIDEAIKALENQKTGHWIDEGGDWYRCSECDNLVSMNYFDFCPNCGCNMEGE